MVLANGILTIARHYLGSAEGGSNHHHIIDTYNSKKPLPRGYAVKYTDDWCATFVSFVGIEAGVPDLYGRECGVERFIDIFKSKGIWLEDGTITPQAGDIITYNWDDGTQPNDGFADHIGFVESVSGGLITTVEGNKNDSVQRRTISVGAGNIRGYARPAYGASTPSTPVPGKSITEIAKEVINGKWGNGADRATKLSQAGYNSAAVQTEVNRLLKGGKPAPATKPKPTIAQITVDGWWGTNTTRRIQQVLDVTADGIIGPNTIRAIQKAVGVTADGIIGPNTIKAMQRHFGTGVDGRISKPSAMVKAMQSRLNQNKF